VSDLDEPAPAEPTADAGSRASGGGDSAAAGAAPPDQLRDVGRALLCALLVAGCVASPAAALAVAPFVPALAAIRLARRAGRGRFLVSAGSASVVAAVLVVPGDSALAASLVGAVLLSVVLAVLHRHAAGRDPAAIVVEPTWPEPRALHGFTPAVAGWAAAVALVLAVVVATGAAPAPEGIGRDLVDRAYAPYEDGCAADGVFESQEELCANILEQRAEVRRLVGSRASELAAALAAVFAFGAAATAHLVVLARSRKVSDSVRPAWRLEQLEVHWSFAYVLTAGLVCWMLALEMSGDAGLAMRLVAVALGTLGALAVVSQGTGLVTWITQRGRRPSLVQAIIVVGLLVASPIVLGFLFLMGLLDLAIHPRRRALRADSPG
jgi:hypothetical protein